mmetsp:Transcript_22119/g.19671  ORF Transcript_22119/g.19671 Transcript_22119/m.19671 type:complete len:82 (+) Transcript_22119:14-259(+)
MEPRENKLEESKIAELYLSTLISNLNEKAIGALIYKHTILSTTARELNNEIIKCNQEESFLLKSKTKMTPLKFTKMRTLSI